MSKTNIKTEIPSEVIEKGVNGITDLFRSMNLHPVAAVSILKITEKFICDMHGISDVDEVKVLSLEDGSDLLAKKAKPEWN